MKILITGGAGFVGGNLAEYFAVRDNEVVCMDNLVRRGSEINLTRFLEYKNIRFVHGDIRNKEDFINLNFKPDVVLECAAQVTAIDGFNNPYYDVTNNFLGVVNVLEYCSKNNSSLIFWNSNKAYSGELCNSVPHRELEKRLEWDDYADFDLRGWTKNGFSEELDINGNQHTIYGSTKLAAELICQDWSKSFNVPIISNRFSCLYGSNQFGKVSQGWVMWFITAKLLNEKLSFYGFGGKQVRDCLYIDDVCELIELQINNIETHNGSYYNVGGGVNNTISLVELVDMLDENVLLKKKNNMLIKYCKEPRMFDQKIYISDIGKVSRDFGWTPKVGVDDGVDMCVQWAIDNLDKLKKIL